MFSPLLMVALPLAANPRLEALYRSARSYDKRSFRFRIPDDVPLRRMQALVSRVVRALAPGPPPTTLLGAARTAGLELCAARDAGGELWVLREPVGRREGSGFFAFRPGGVPVCIQAPHTFFEERTGEIGLQLFTRLRAGAAFFNTVHRHARAATDDHPADVAHAERTLFAAANHGLCEAGRWDIVQVHGFGDRQDLPPEVQAVVSDGVPARPPHAPVERLRAALAVRLGEGAVRLFGDDTSVLGATTNVEGRAARSAGATFLHVELAAATRRALAQDVMPLADALAEALPRSRPGIAPAL